MENPFIQLLSNFEDLKIEDLQEIQSLIEIKSYEKGDILMYPEQSNDKLCYITKGLVRIYHILENGEEKTISLRWENTFFGNYDVILFDRPSRFFQQAMENTQMLQISYNRLKEVLEKNNDLAKIERQVMRNIIGLLLERNEDFIILSAEQRYLKILKENKTIINRVQDKYLASLLGVTPVSLSRIKKRIMKGN